MYLQSIHQILKELESSGWDKFAIRYVRKKMSRSLVSFAAKKDLQTWYYSTHFIGSSVYTSMLKKSKLSKKQKLELVLSQLGATVGKDNFLYLNGNFWLDPTMVPHSKFLHYFRFLVQSVFPGKSLKEYSNSHELGDLAQKIHLFRSYIDYNNIRYIRNFWVGETDYDKLLSYEKSILFLRLDYKSNANFHNRHLSNNEFKFPQNMKVQVPYSSRMSEFIINLETGNFVSEWLGYGFLESNVNLSNRTREFNIANTESFNYGTPKGDRKLFLGLNGENHQKLDVKHPNDANCRKNLLKKNNNNYWKAEEMYYKKNDEKQYTGLYVDIVKKGKMDFLAWRSVSEDDKPYFYQEFIKYCRKIYPQKNPGFYIFLKIINENKF